MNQGNYTLGELIFDVGCLVKKYEQTLIKKDDGELLKTKQVLEKYPLLTQYAIDQAVRENELPVIKRGRLNFFDTRDIEKYIQGQKVVSKNDCISNRVKYL